jgi:hypothetical protein
LRGRAHTLDSHVEALAGLRDGDARFAFPAKQRHQCSLDLWQAGEDAAAEHAAMSTISCEREAR